MARRSSSSNQIAYEANASAIPFHQSRARVKGLMGPVGSGKSLAWMMQFVMHATRLTTSLRSVVIRQSWPELRDSTKVTWEKWLAPISEWRQTDHQMSVTLRGSKDGIVRQHTMDFRHAKRPADATRFLSTEYGQIILEECVPAFDVGRGVIGGGIAKEIFDVALLRLRQPEVPDPELLCIFNAPPKRHWTYQNLVGPSTSPEGRETLRRKGYAFFSQPAFENKKHLPAGYYESLLETLSPELADRFVRGIPLTVFPGMPVYQEILEDVHIVEDLPLLRSLGLITMHDFGRTPAAIIAQVTQEGQMRFLREIQLWGASSERMAEVLERVLRDDFRGLPWVRGWGDPAGQNPTETDDRTSFQILAAKGFPLSPGAETFAARKEAMKQRAARMVGREPALLISSSGCPLLCEALLGGYRYPKSADGQIGESPLKNDYSHLANAAEYGVSGEFSIYTGERATEDARVKSARLIPRFHPLSTPVDHGGGGWMSS